MCFKRKRFSIALFAVFLCFKSGNFVNAKTVIVPLKDDLKLLKELREYKVHQELCDKYLDRYVAVKNIEYYDFNGNLLNNGVIVVQDTVADSVVDIFEELRGDNENTLVKGMKTDEFNQDIYKTLADSITSILKILKSL